MLDLSQNVHRSLTKNLSITIAQGLHWLKLSWLNCENPTGTSSFSVSSILAKEINTALPNLHLQQRYCHRQWQQHTISITFYVFLNIKEGWKERKTGLALHLTVVIEIPMVIDIPHWPWLQVSFWEYWHQSHNILPGTFGWWICLLCQNQYSVAEMLTRVITPYRDIK